MVCWSYCGDIRYFSPCDSPPRWPFSSLHYATTHYYPFVLRPFFTFTPRYPHVARSWLSSLSKKIKWEREREAKWTHPNLRSKTSVRGVTLLAHCKNLRVKRPSSPQTHAYNTRTHARGCQKKKKTHPLSYAARWYSTLDLVFSSLYFFFVPHQRPLYRQREPSLSLPNFMATLSLP